MKIISTVLLVFLLVNCVKSFHFSQGNVSKGVVLAKSIRIQYNAKPFSGRAKTFFYPGMVNEIIQGIQAVDNLQSHAFVEITDGGVGHIFVNMKFSSDEGEGLDYDVEIYVKPAF